MTNPRPTLTLDVDLYQHMLDNTDLTDAEKHELLQTLWSVVCEFVMLGWNIHPLQQAQQTSGESAEIMPDSHLLDTDMLTSLMQEKETYL